MIIPIRCFGCGKPTAHLWEKYNEELKKGKSPKEVLDKIGMERYCCRSLFLGHIDLLETIAKFKKG
ncbi:DNA-directed RNA polymerase subunit N [Candidatus Woesearchaeota archaeon]|nr:DNA-directed RNA polymerase subunit N [Candidatus Woesearchaeota archaeon]